MTDLLLRQVAESRAGAEGQDDFDVIGPDGIQRQARISRLLGGCGRGLPLLRARRQG